MLEKIVFLIMDETQLESADRLKRSLDAEGNRIHLWGPECLQEQENRVENEGAEDGRTEDAATGCRMDDMPQCLRDYRKETTLFVTDASVVLQELKRQGWYIIAFLHANNGSQDWSGAAYAIADIEELEMDSFVKAYQRMAGEPWTVLETERCVIRETTVEDVEEFYRIYAEPSITYYMDPLYEKPEEERAYAEEYREKVYGFYGYGMWSIVRKETNRVIGRAGLSWREGYDVPELGFMIEAAYQRQGYAEEVCRAILEYGRNELEFEEVQALVKAQNAASVGLCRKLGFAWEAQVEERGEVYERYIFRKAADTENLYQK